MNESPEVFAIILNYNGYEDTKKCIESFKKVTYKNLKLILVDNCSTDGSFSLLEKEYLDIPLLKTEVNKGYAGGMNFGIKYALGKGARYIILVNNDIVVTPNFLEPMLELAVSDNTIGLVSGKVLYRNDPHKIYCAGGRISNIFCGGIAEFQGKSAQDFANDLRFTTLAEGCFLLVNSEVFRKIGLIDEKFFMYFEDIEFSERVNKQFKIIYTNKSIIYHKSGAGTSWEEFTPLYYYYYTRNRMWFFSGKTFFLKLYVMLFSVVNSCAKFMVLAKAYFIKVNKRKAIKSSLISLFNGTLDGIKLLWID